MCIYMENILSHSVGYIFFQSTVPFAISKPLIFYILFILEHVYVWTYIYHSMHKGHRTTYEVFSLLPPCGSWGSNPDFQVCLHLQSDRYLHLPSHLTSTRCLLNYMSFVGFISWVTRIYSSNLPISACLLQQCHFLVIYILRSLIHLE